MGSPNVDGMYDMALSLTEGMPSEGVIDTLNQYWRDEYGFSSELQKLVLEWLLNTVDTSKYSCRKEALLNANSDYYINFNYTDTLECVYGIKKRLAYTRRCSLMFGYTSDYGTRKQVFNSKKQRAGKTVF